jgi:parallel beta-helix repeat protein
MWGFCINNIVTVQLYTELYCKEKKCDILRCINYLIIHLCFQEMTFSYMYTPFAWISGVSPRRFLRSTLVVLSFFIVTGAVLYAYQQVFAFPGEGAGTAEDPYIITSCAELVEIDNNLSAHFSLTTNLTCTTENFPLARVMAGSDLDGAFDGFSGTLDGNGNTINYTKNVPDGVDTDNYLGLFGYVNGGTVRDLVLEESSGTLTGGDSVGLLAGKANNALFINITSESSVSASASVGGLVGEMAYSRIIGAHFFGSVNGTAQTGGLVGNVLGNYLDPEGLPAIEQSFVSDTASVNGAGNTGGLVGYLSGGIIKNSYSSANVQGTSDVGGLAGLGNGAGIINSYASGDVSGADNVGGLVGISFNAVATIEFSFSAATVTGTSYVGAIVGGLEYSGSDDLSMLSATGTHFDLSQQDGVTDCSGLGRSTFSDGCLSMTPGDPSTYWKLPGGVPMNVWDQVNVWQMESMTNYPALFNYVEPTIFAGGAGTEGDPYIIETCAQLQNIQDYLTSYFKLDGPEGVIDCSATDGWNENTDEWVDEIVDGELIPDEYVGVINNGYKGFDPIGNGGAEEYFTGSFDGNGNTITDLWIFRKDENYVGLFSAFGEGASVFDVTLSGANIVGGAHTGGVVGSIVENSTIDHVVVDGSMVRAYLSYYGGGITGQMMGSESAITSSTVTNGTVHGSGNVIGGIVGYLVDGSITNATSTANIDGGEYIGGAVGQMVTGTVTNVHVFGDVDSNFSEDVYLSGVAKNGQYTGGFVGHISGGLITESSASGDVTFQGNYGGGFVGKINDGAITYATSTGNVTALARVIDEISYYPDYVGGFAGNIENNSFNYETPDELGIVLTHLYASSTVYAPTSSYVGGFAGYIVNRSIASSTAVGAVTGEQYVGGFGGLTGCYSEFRDSSAAVDVVSLDGYAGGFSGFDGCEGDGSEFIRVSATGDVVSSPGTTTGVGGLIGAIYRASVVDSFATGAVSSTGSEVGGLIGTAAYNVSVDTSYATGDVYGEGYNVGGLIGQIIGQDGQLATVTNVYARGDVSTMSGQIGGLIGYMDSYVTVSNAYATGFGGEGLVGLSSGGTVETSFWDTQTSDTENGCGGSCGGATGRNTLQMSIQSTFDEASWDFETIWGINETDNDEYPFLQIQGYEYDYVPLVDISGGTGTEEDPYIAVRCFDAENPGYYELGDDLSTTGDCITIATSSVSIDGAGYSISGDDGDMGIKVAEGGPYTDIHVHDITVIDFNYGMRFDVTSDSVIENNIVTSTQDYGVYFYNSFDNTITSNTFSDMWRGVVLVEFTTSTLVSTNTFSNLGTAIFVDEDSIDNTISHNTITDAEYGMYVDDDSHGCYIGYNDITDVTYGFFIDETDNCIVEYNTITLSRYNFGEGSSSPLVFTWNGEEYDYIADVGRGIPRNVTGLDNATIPSESLVPQDDKYSVKISQEYNEIVYYDELALMTFDHAPGYNVVTSLQRNKEGQFFTISDTPSHPMTSCTDMYGNDCLESLQASDDKWSYKDESNLNYWIMNFGDLSEAERIQLVVQGARDYSLTSASLRTIQVKDAEGNWVNAYSGSTISSPGGSPRTQVIDLTGKFVGDDYSVKFGYDRTVMNYVAIDTSAPQSYTVNTIHPSSVDLQFRGYTAIDKTYFWDHDYETVFETPEHRFAPQVGMFTKYGEVSPLLEETDDQFVIMHHGDHMSIEFDYTPPAEGLERSFVLHNWATFKHADMDGGVGMTVEPLPFNGMTAYPPVAPQTYPMTDENELYRKTWNTREVKSGAATAFPYSENTTVRYNTINSLIESEDPYAGDYGLHMYYETSSTVHNNTISGFDYGIYIENSESITVHHNTVNDINYDGVYVNNTDDLTITYNTIFDIRDDDGMDIQGSDNVTIATNTISNIDDSGLEIDEGEVYSIRGNIMSDIGDDGMDLDTLTDIDITGNTVNGVEDVGIYLSSSQEYTISDNIVSSTWGSLYINGEYSAPGGRSEPDTAYSGSFSWYSNYADGQQTFLQRTLDLTGAESTASFDYWMWYGTEGCCDYIYTEVSTDDGLNWTAVGSSYSGNGQSWSNYDVSLDSYIGQTILFRMRFQTDGSVLGDGVYLDNLSLTVDGSEVFTDTFESGAGSWSVVSDSGPDWELISLGAAEEEEIDIVKGVFDNTFTSGNIEATVVSFENSYSISFVGNTLRGTNWIYNNSENDFNDSDSGNTYLFADGSGAWTVYDITDSNGDGWADGGSDRPFSSSTLTTALWNGIGEDEYPATEIAYVAPHSGAASSISISRPIPINDTTLTNGALKINDGAATTDKTAVTLTINAKNATEMVISNSSDFSNSTYVPFKALVSHTLTSGNGTKTVYVKLRSSQGGTVTISDGITLSGQKESQVETSTTTPSEKLEMSQPDIAIPTNGLKCDANVYLKTPVKLGAVNNPNDVKLLEQFLNTYEGTNLEVNGIYETVDFNAVVKWQEKYASDILTPWGMIKGSGYVYTTSLKKIKEIHEKNCATATPVAPAQPTTPVTASCLNTETTLTQGMTGALVTTAQTLLRKLNFFSVAPTGFFGPVTATSVKAFQATNGIDPVGYIGPATRARLNELGCR